ncbi:MAG: glycosyltransferase family 4 protein [Candidatus Omnitrophica bacterium]|nr:glycosyltransferase family 4 protein [Candidatus Omnitrophota bacterium]
MSRPIRIGYYVLTTGFGGLELNLLAILQQLDRRAFEPILYFRCLDPSGEARMRRELAVLQVPIRPLDDEGLPLDLALALRGSAQTPPVATSSSTINPAPRIGTRPGVVRNASRALRQAWYYWRCTRAIAGVFRSERLDVIHVLHGWYPSLELPVIAGRLAEVPVRLSDVWLEPSTFADRRWIHKQLVWLAVRSVTRVRAMYGRMAEELHTKFGVPRERMIVIPNGIELERFTGLNGAAEVRTELRAGAQDRLIAVPARLSPEKGHRVLLDAAASLRARHPDAHYLFIGDGVLREELRRLVAICGLADRVYFLGFRTDLPRLLAAADLVVLPSFTEGVPGVLLEAMAAGTPIVATDVGGVGELLAGGRVGRLVPPGDPAALGQAIDELLSADEDVRRRLGAQAQARVQQQYTKRQMVERFIALYQLNRHRQHIDTTETRNSAETQRGAQNVFCASASSRRFRGDQPGPDT